MNSLPAIESPKALAIVPARGGSKGLPGKNLMVVAGQSLVARAVTCARQAGIFADVVISTDDPAIAAEAERAGARVPFLRPQYLATDKANIKDAVLHLLQDIERMSGARFDVVVLLEPTSPARTAEIVKQAVSLAIKEGCDAAFTVSEVPLKYHPQKQFSRNEQGQATFAHPDGASIVNRQQLTPTYIRNGLCYAVRTSALAEGHGLTGSKSQLVVVEGPVINIDDQADLELAREVLGH